MPLGIAQLQGRPEMGSENGLLPASSSSSANPMNVVLGVGWYIIVDHAIHSRNV